MQDETVIGVVSARVLIVSSQSKQTAGVTDPAVSVGGDGKLEHQLSFGKTLATKLQSSNA